MFLKKKDMIGIILFLIILVFSMVSAILFAIFWLMKNGFGTPEEDFEDGWKCQSCLRTLSSFDNLKRHFKEKHLKMKRKQKKQEKQPNFNKIEIEDSLKKIKEKLNQIKEIDE